MKKIILTALTVFCFAGAFAQLSNVVLFTENGERFYAILNGLRMNDEPVTNLKVEDLNQPGYKLKIIFENTDLGQMDKNLYCQPGEESVYMIKQGKNGEYKLAIRSSVPIAQAAPVADNVYLYHWGTGGVSNSAPANTAVTTTVIEETTTTTTTTNGTSMGTNVNTGTGENVSMNVNVDGFGMNVNINTSDNMGMTNSGAAVSTTTTTTTTTTTGGVAQNDVVYVEEAPCAYMSAGDYESARASIKSKSFSDSKMTLAKQVTRSNCISAAQVKGIVELFDFEADRLEYAKFAYPFCYEQNKYYLVNDAFDFESTIEELDEYISGMH